jgi:hypothetical protein
MRTSDILARSEGPTLEFKSAAALQQPAIVARAAVALLNARGGAIWIGVKEAGHRAVAVDPFPDADRARRRLLDHLIDAIEPTPTDDELGIEVVQLDDPPGGSILRVDVRPDDAKRPYAQISGPARTFVIRVGDRIATMSREQLRKLLAGAPQDDPAAETKKYVLERRTVIRRTAAGKLSVCIHPSADLQLRLGDPEFRLLLREPERTGNRPMGWVFALTEEPVRRSGKLVFGHEQGRQTTLHRCGTIEFTVPIARILWAGHSPNAASPTAEIHPLALCEYPTSVLRLASHAYRGLADAPVREDIDVVVDLALPGARGLLLRPYVPGSAGFESDDGKLFEEDDLLLEQPLVVRMQRLVNSPDECAFLLMQRVYEAFGYEERFLPLAFDRKTGKFTLPP